MLKLILKKSAAAMPAVVAVSLVAFLGAGNSAKAQVIASEGFDYPAGTSVLGLSSAGGGWASSWLDKNNLDVLQSGSLSYTDGDGNTLATSGNSLQSNGGANPATSSSEPSRTLSSTFGALGAANTADPGTLWMSFLWQGNNTSANGSFFRQATMGFFAGQGTSSPGGTETVDIGMPNISSANVTTVNPDISLWAKTGSTSVAPVQSTVAANTGATDFILIEMVLDNTTAADVMDVWINPILGGTLGTPDITYNLQDLSSINGIRISGGGYNATYGSLPGEQTVDEINFGDTVADVEPVPEPTTMALAGLCGTALLALRRRRA